MISKGALGISRKDISFLNKSAQESKPERKGWLERIGFLKK
jgi:hypothetical protein